MKLLTDYSTTGLTDGKLQCTYQQVPGILGAIDNLFQQKGLDCSARFVLECQNTVIDALVLLFFIEKGISFLVLPKLVNTPENGYSGIPRFFRYMVSSENPVEGNTLNFEYIVKSLKIVDNPQWVDTREVDTGARVKQDVAPKLYMRTSGSTGNPKMVVHSHGSLLGNIQNCVHRLGLNSEDRIAIPVPIFHMYGLGAAFLPGVAAGASIDLQKGANLLRYLQREQTFAPNIAFMTPIFCEALLKGRKSSRPYRFTVAAGDRVRQDAFSAYEAQFGSLLKLYGSTEMGAIAAVSPEDPLEVRAQTVGLPMPGVEMHLDCNGIEAGDDMEGVGELWCHHPYSFEGYVDFEGKPTKQAEAKQEGWFRTKDLGRIWSEGPVEVLGRGDHSVNRDGLLVFFSEVAKAIETISGIEAVVVISKGESQRGKAIIAYCVLDKSAAMTEDEIRTACFELLPKRAVPDAVFIMKALPLLPNGKVDRQKLIGMTALSEQTVTH